MVGGHGLGKTFWGKSRADSSADSQANPMRERRWFDWIRLGKSPPATETLICSQDSAKQNPGEFEAMAGGPGFRDRVCH
jgi:hypothetical protein